MELQNDFTMQEFNSLHADLKGLDPEQAARRRRKNHQLVCRLAPGRSCQSFAIDNPAGEATTDPQEMLRLLRGHWEQVFKKTDVDRQLLGSWLQEDAQHLPPDYHDYLPHDMVPKTIFRKAILLTGNSSPGRDGIPFKAWRRVVDLAAGVLEEAYKELTAENSIDHVRAEWSSFNESIMVFIPKKAVSTRADGMEVFPPGNMRPLNLTNTDNRIICSAVRLHIETQVAPRCFFRAARIYSCTFHAIERDRRRGGLDRLRLHA